MLHGDAPRTERAASERPFLSTGGPENSHLEGDPVYSQDEWL